MALADQDVERICKAFIRLLLGADISQFCREVEEMPYVFPHYESWVDRRNIRDKN